MTKTNSKFLTSLMAMLFFTPAVITQNWIDLDSKSVKELSESVLIRAAEVTILPREKGSVHTHPAHFFYALTDCHLIVHYTDGTQTRYDLKPGEGGYSDPERPHQTENVGDKSAKFLIVELKEHPYKPIKGKKTTGN